jgi:hypothetical protein
MSDFKNTTLEYAAGIVKSVYTAYTILFLTSIKPGSKTAYQGTRETIKTNYRPVSVSAVSSKLLEKATHRRFNQNQRPKNILLTERYGFWKGMSTEDTAFIIFKSVNQNVYVGRIFCDWI